MKAVSINSYGHSDQMQIVDAARPTPKDNEVLVQIFDAGVNPVDWKIREGYLKEVMPAKFPLILGQDFAGQVIEVGKQVHNFKTGDRVFGFAHGAYAEFACVAEHKIAKIPEHMDFVTGASLPTAGITAYQLIMKSVDLQAGQSVLIHGAGGGVGSFAVQLALWKKARVYATASEADIEYLRSLGVENIINFEKENFLDRVPEVDIVIDLVGGKTLDESFKVVKTGGVVASTVGSLKDEFLQSKKVKGVRFLAQQNSEDLQEMAKLVEQGVLKPRIHEVLPLEKAREAQDDLQKGHSMGKIILEVRH